MKLEIVKYPAPVLLKRAELVKDVSEVRKLIRDMFDTLYDTKSGVGLAAPQVGFGVRLFVVNLTREKKNELVFINPEVERESMAQKQEVEGCLSLPGLQVTVSRCEKIVVNAFDANGRVKKHTLEGFMARVVQHEYDHLQGVLTIHRTKRLTRDQMKQLSKMTDEARVRSEQTT